MSPQAVGRCLKDLLVNAWGEDPRRLQGEPPGPSFPLTAITYQVPALCWGYSRDQNRYSSVPSGFHVSSQINREKPTNAASFEAPRPDAYQPVVLSGGLFGNMQRHFWLSSPLGEASKRPGMLLDVPRHAGQSPTAKNHGATMPVMPRFGSLVRAFRLCTAET